MKKKTVRKVSSGKKSLSRSPKQKKFSLKSWLFGGLVLAIALAVGMYKLQPKSVKVLEVPGDAFEYIKPAKIDINVVGAKCTGSKDEEMTCTDASGKTTTTTYVDAKASKVTTTSTIVDKDPDLGVVGRTTITNTRDISVKPATATDPNPDNQTKQGGTNTTTIQETTYNRIDANGDGVIQEKEVQAVQGNTTVRQIDNYNTYNETTTITEKNTQGEVINTQTFKTGGKNQDTPKLSSNPTQGSSGNGSCSTVAGFSVHTGSRMIGPANEVYECQSNGSWQGKDCKYDPKDITSIDRCKINILPSYAQQTGHANCYIDGGSLVVGNGSVEDAGGGKGKRCDNGNMTSVTKVDGSWLSDEDLVKVNCNKSGLPYADGKCGKATTESCKGAGMALGKDGECKPTAAAIVPPTKLTPYRYQGCVNIVNTKTEKCQKSSDNPNLYFVVPLSNTTPIKSGVNSAVSSEINKTTTSSTTKTFKSGAECDKVLTSGYTCEPIAGGNYYALTPQRQYVNAPGSFGAPSQPQVISKETSNEARTVCRDLIKKYSGGDCLEQGVGGDGNYVVNFVPPNANTSSSNSTSTTTQNPGKLFTSDDLKQNRTDCQALVDKSGGACIESTSYGLTTVQYVPKQTSSTSQTNSNNDIVVNNNEKPVVSGIKGGGGATALCIGAVLLATGGVGWPVAAGCGLIGAGTGLGIYTYKSDKSAPTIIDQIVSGSTRNSDNQDSPYNKPIPKKGDKRCSPTENQNSSIEIYNPVLGIFYNWEYSGVTCPFGCENGQCKQSQ